MTPPETVINCREAVSLLPLFFDGELDARQMRAVALHGTRCPSCESELRALERVQSLVSESIHRHVEKLDFSGFWDAIEPQLQRRSRPHHRRVVHWWSRFNDQPAVTWPAVAAMAAAALFAFYLYTQTQQPVPATRPTVASLDSPALIDSIDTDVESVAVVNDPDNSTTVLWVSDESAPKAEAEQ